MADAAALESRVRSSRVRSSQCGGHQQPRRESRGLGERRYDTGVEGKEAVVAAGVRQGGGGGMRGRGQGQGSGSGEGTKAANPKRGLTEHVTPSAGMGFWWDVERRDCAITLLSLNE